MNTLYSFDRKSKKNEELLSIPNGYFQALATSKEGVWAANAFTVFLLSNGKIVKNFDFSNHARFILDIFKDSKGNLWIAQPGYSYAFMIDSNMKLHQFKIPLGKEGVINLIREEKEGMYICSTGKDSYLFLKGSKDSVFRNISVPVKFQTHGDFNISDITFLDNKLWLASSEGLLHKLRDDSSIERVDLGSAFTGLSVKSLELYQGNKVLFANAYGLILYDPSSKSYDLFNESNGLSSNTLTERGLFVAHDNSVWIGTSKGLCYTNEPLTAMQRTPVPHIVDFRANGKKVKSKNEKEIAYGSFITASLSAITFPETRI